MGASPAFRKCIRQSLARPAWRLELHTASTSKSAQQHITRTSIRTFTSTSQTRQDQPPQPIPVSNEKNLDEAVGTLPSSANGPVKPNSKTRIDLSSLPGIQSTSQTPSSAANTVITAREKLNALYRESQQRASPSPTTEDPYTKAIRDTDALNKSSPMRMQKDSTTLNLKSLLEILDPRHQRDKDKDKPETKLPLRLRPTLGRTAAVDHNRGTDVTRAFRKLEIKCATNQVRKDSNAQRFHVRRGQARKLQRSLRWRAQFRAGFLEECARIRRMKNQGW